MSGLILVGAGGLAREVLAGLRRCGAPEPLGFLDDAAVLRGGSVDGLPVLGPPEDAALGDEMLLLCPGRGRARLLLHEGLARLGVGYSRYATYVDPAAWVGAGCRVGSGSILLAGAVVTADAVLGHHVVLMPHVVVTHDDVLEDCVTLASGVCLGGGVRVGRAAYLGMNATVREHVIVGAGAMVGMGAVVLTNVPSHETWAGVPAQALDGVRS